MAEKTERRRNWAPWLALLFVVVVIALNATAFVGIPGQGPIQWLILAFGIGAVLWAVIGVRRAFGQSHLYGGKITGCIFGVLALLVCGLVVFGWIHARDLPSSAGAPKVGQKAPDFTLTDTNNNQVSLGQLLSTAQDGTAANATGAAPARSPAPKAVLLIFYRGYW
ncbi:MAG TPA: hypothetical protein VIB39_20135 [Candidatus Angelobacter sp.]|jgi:hypothetical protein